MLSDRRRALTSKGTVGALALISLAAFATLAPSPGAPPPADSPDSPVPAAPRQTCQLVVGLSASPARFDEVASSLARRLEGRVVRSLSELSCVVLEAPGRGPELCAALRGQPDVAFAEPNRPAEPAAGPGRCTCQGEPRSTPAPLELRDLGDWATHLELAMAWKDAPEEGAGVVVGVVDTGVDQELEALKSACEPAIDLVVEGGAAADGHGHGTGMAGLIAGRGDEGRGFRGVAPRARILPVRVASDRGQATLDVVARGIVAAAERGARVIYVGLGVRGRSPTLAAAVAKARAAGSLVVCPAGNDGLDVLVSPAAEPGALAVAGLGSCESLAAATNVSPAVRLAAPSEHVPAPGRGAVRFTDGTSAAAAITAGVAALVLSHAPTLDTDGLERALLAGARPLFPREPGALPSRLPLGALDPVAAVARAGAKHAELAVAEVRVAPDPPVAGAAAELRLLIENRGQVPLVTAELAAAVGSLTLTARAEDLKPGEARWVALPWTPAAAEEWLAVDVKGRGIPAAAADEQGPPLPVIARARSEVLAVREPVPSCAVSGIELVEWPTIERPRATWEVRLENRGAAPAALELAAAVDGARLPAQQLVLGPGQVATRRFQWSAEAPPAAPVGFEACLTVQGSEDAWVEDDYDTFLAALQDPSLPLSPHYRQAGDIDFAIDAPWRVAADRDHVPLLVFVPSIGRPSRYATFHETLAMRRGVVARLGATSRGGRIAGVAGRTAGNLTTYTTATFLKELAAAHHGDDQAIRRFFDRIMTTDFAIDYASYAVGAWGGAKGFELVADRAKTVRGLRWTGTNLGSTIARSWASVGVGYLLPNLIRGRLDRRVAIDLAAIGLTTAGVETLAHGIRTGLSRTTIGSNTAAWLARHGKVARAGGFVVEVGKLVLILYASELISEAIDRPLVRWEAKRALSRSWEAARAKANAPEAEFEAALEQLEDAFDAYRNVIAGEIEWELRGLNKALGGVARGLHEIDTIRTRAADLPPALRDSSERVIAAKEEESKSALSQVLKRFEERFLATMRTLYDVNATASLNEPGHSKPAVYDLELELLGQLAGLVQGERRARLGQKVETLERLRGLDVELTRALLATGPTTPGVVIDPIQLAGTDGLVLKKARIVARDAWQFEAEDTGELERVGPGRLVRRGGVKEALVYAHDVAQDRYEAAPGVVRTDENMVVMDSPALLDMPRPLTIKGRYNILRIPRHMLEPVSVGGQTWLHVQLEWELTKVIRGEVVRPAEGTYAQMFQVQLGNPGLPQLPGLAGQYLDAHYHTIAEWYNPEPGFVADLQLDAPRQKYGGPIPMLVESAYAVGAIDAPTFAAAKDRLVTTDHNAFYVLDDTLSNRPPFGPTSARQSEGKGEFEQMRRLLGQSAGEELCYEKDGLKSVGVHMLDYRARHYDGTWNAKPPLGRYLHSLLRGMELPTMERVLGEMAQGGQGNEHAFAYASHPVSSIPWEDGKLEAALKDYERAADKSFPFKGMQVWNTRPARTHSAHKLYKYLDNLNPFVNAGWQGGTSFDKEIHEALVKYRHLLNKYALFRLPSDPTRRLVRKHYIVAGSDSHGDFNYTVGGLATVITAILGENDRTDDTIEVHDSAFMRVRNFAATQGYGQPDAMEALAHGALVITDGPLVWFELDGDGRFDADALTYEAAATPRFKDREGRIGGGGAYDGERTVLVANDARPVFRYSYTNFDEFGRPTHKDQLGRPTVRDGSIASISIYKTDLGSASFAAGSGSRMAGNGSLETHGGRQFGKVFFEPMNPQEEGLPATVSAIQVGASTGGDVDTSPADVYRAITNPVWVVRLDVQGLVDAARFDAATGTIAPGGLKVELKSPVSLGKQRVELVLCALDAQGKSGAPLLQLTPEGWADGQDEQGQSYQGGLFRATNREPLRLRDLPRYGAAGKVTLVVMTKDPLQDSFGNVLNRVAATFEVDPQTGTPGSGAAAAANLRPVDGNGFTEALERR